MEGAVYAVRHTSGTDPHVVGALAQGGQLVVVLLSASPWPASPRDREPLLSGVITAEGDGGALRSRAAGITGFGPRWIYLEFEGLPDPAPDSIRLTFGPSEQVATTELTRCAGAAP
jgi:hypothetical protein